MPVKIYQNIIIDGKKLKSANYLPKGTLVTSSVKNQAEKLDIDLKKLIADINKEFHQLKKSEVNSPETKWMWLGKKIDALLTALKKLQSLSELDISTDSIWPAISQYLDPELRRDADKKRVGTRKDHLRKCWLFATFPDTDWFNTWSSWDAFIDRGEHLVYNGKIFHLLKKVIPNSKLNSRDYQKIAKLMAGMFPQKSKNLESVQHISEEDLLVMVKQVREEFLKSK